MASVNNGQSDQIMDLVVGDLNSNLSAVDLDNDSSAFDALQSNVVQSSRRRKDKVLVTPTAVDAKVYSMTGTKRGKVLIFNNVNFEKKKKYAKREGSDMDVKRLRHTLPLLGFQKEDITVYTDLDYYNLFWTVKNLPHDSQLEQSDCLVVIILTHGKESDKLMAKDKSYNLYKLISEFTPSVLKSMAGKPKLFIVQACRGTKHDVGIQLCSHPVEPDSDNDQMDSQSEVFIYPEYADFLIAMSSHHGHYSFRNQKTGSWLIQELCNVIEECSKESRLEMTSFIDILTETNLAVSKRCSAAEGNCNMKKQVSSFYSTLTRKIFFGPTETENLE